MSESKQGNRLYKGNYKEISDQLKLDALDGAIQQQLSLLADVKRRGKVDLNSVDELEAVATSYMNSCRAAGVFPSMLGFSAACGYSRKQVYEYISRHGGTPSAEYLDALRCSWAAIIAQMGLARQCSEAVAIFLLKNCGQGMHDKAELDISTTRADPLGRGLTPEELAAKYAESVEVDYSVR